MRVYRRRTQRYTGGVWAYPAPTATVAVRTTAGTLVENLTAAYNATYRRLYIDTTNALYTNGTLYLAYWTVTIGGTAYALATPLPFVHVTPTTSDVTGPGVPVLGEPSADEDSATFPLTPPADADYHHTTVYAVPVGGGTVLSGTTTSATATSVTVAGMAAGTMYIYTALAYDAAGNPSAVGGYALGALTTPPASSIARPALVKWFINDEVDYSEFGPEEVDPLAGGVQRIPALGRGRELSILIECHEPVAVLRIRGLGVWAQVPTQRPGGLRNVTGT